MTRIPTPDIEAQTPCGLNHLVLNVRDIEESHRFWTELLGFRQSARLVAPIRTADPRCASTAASGTASCGTMISR